MIDDVRDSVVIIQSDDDYGSGIIFNVETENQTKKYAVLTAYSNIDTSLLATMTIELENNNTYMVTDVLTNETYGFAIAYFETNDDLNIYTIDQLDGQTIVPITQGIDVYEIGTPYQQLFFNYVSEGIVGLEPYTNNGIEDLLFMHSAESNPGMEGAPVFSLNGELLGIYVDKIYTTESSEETLPIEGMNFALNMNVIASEMIAMDNDLILLNHQSNTIDLVAEDETYNDLVVEMLEKATPSVISVIGTGGLGSGIIYDVETLESGLFRYYALTNHHVVDGSDEIKIRFDEETFQIAVTDYQTSEAYDIAVLRIETDEVLPVYDIPPITQNEYVDIVNGQDVYAIGSPYSESYHNYVTQGVLSMTSFSYKGIRNLGIVHDAEINPGNSGGPLFNLNGEVIGVNVAKVISVNEDNQEYLLEGINYSLNINIISQVVNSFLESNYTDVVRTPKIGVTVSDYSIEYDVYPIQYNQGVFVIGFDYTRSSYEVLKVEDLIISVNTYSISGIEDLALILQDKEFGDTLTLGIVRMIEGEAVEMTVEITLS